MTWLKHNPKTEKEKPQRQEVKYTKSPEKGINKLRQERQDKNPKPWFWIPYLISFEFYIRTLKLNLVSDDLPDIKETNRLSGLMEVRDLVFD